MTCKAHVVEHEEHRLALRRPQLRSELLVGSGAGIADKGVLALLPCLHILRSKLGKDAAGVLLISGGTAPASVRDEPGCIDGAV